MKFTLISGIPLSFVARLGAPLHPLFGDAVGTSEAPVQDAVSPFGCKKKHVKSNKESSSHCTNAILV